MLSRLQSPRPLVSAPMGVESGSGPRGCSRRARWQRMRSRVGAHINGAAVEPSREVEVGDELEITVGHVRRTVIVRAMAERRVSAAQAQTLYDETAESIEERERQAKLRRPARHCVGRRPTKRDRRRTTPLVLVSGQHRRRPNGRHRHAAGESRSVRLRGLAQVGACARIYIGGERVGRRLSIVAAVAAVAVCAARFWRQVPAPRFAR